MLEKGLVGNLAKNFHRYFIHIHTRCIYKSSIVIEVAEFAKPIHWQLNERGHDGHCLKRYRIKKCEKPLTNDGDNSNLAVFERYSKMFKSTEGYLGRTIREN